MRKKIVVFFILCSIISCKMGTVHQAATYASGLIGSNENAIGVIRNTLPIIDSTDNVITFTQKPGSHILETNCNFCTKNLTRDISVQLADYIDALDLTYIAYKRDSYMELGLDLRNHCYNNYFVREYFNLSDTPIYSKSYFEQYHLIDNWMLYSDKRKK